MASSRRRPPLKRSEFAYGTPSYFRDREKRLKAKARGQRLAAESGSKKAARGLRKTERLIEATRARGDFAQRAQEQIRAEGLAEGYQAERRRQRFFVRSFSRLPSAERQRVEALLTTYGSRPVPGNIDTGLSKREFWLFFRAGGTTG
jgi:hypothetical protein